MASPQVRVGIIGCGNIAGGFDVGRAASDGALTHAGAFVRDGRFELAWCTDPDPVRRRAFQDAWGVAAADAAPTAFVGEAVDVISVCAPTPHHHAAVLDALACRPSLIFCEKPLAPDLDAAAALVQACRGAGVMLAVNHTRRWAPDVVRLAADLAAGRWGRVRAAHGWYSKGVLNNGAHLIDLLHMLAGSVRVRAAGRPVWDHWPDDPTIPALLETADGAPVTLGAADARDFALFELTLVTERGVLAMEAGGLRWRVRRAADSETFRGYRTLGAGAEAAGEYDRAMAAAAANIHAAIVEGAPLASTGETALDAQRICAEIRMRADD